MAQQKLTELTDEQLLQVAKKVKPTKVYDSLIIGVLIGIAIYSSFTNGFGLLSFIPLVYVPIAAKNNKKNKELEGLLRERNLE